MTDILKIERSAERFRHLRPEQGAKIRMVALLVSLALHGLLFWWGLVSGRFGAPAEGNLPAIRVFLPAPEVSRPVATPPPLRSPAPPSASSAAPAASALPSETIPPLPAVPPVPAEVSAPPVAAMPELPASPAAAVSLAALPLAVAVAAPVAAGADGPGAPAGRPLGSGPGLPGAATTGASHVAAGANPTGAGVSTGTGGEVVGGEAGGAAKELYLRALFAHIEAHKFYPPAARRRQLEGQVRIALTLEADGGVSELRASAGHPLLEAAALQTVRSSLPLPPPAAGVALPLKLSYRMDFRLR